MKTMKSYAIIMWHLLLLLLVIGCKEEDNIRPFGPDVDKGVPGVLSEIKVKNMPGGAVISYQLPQNSDIMYVKARYTVGQNRQMESRASVYGNELTVNGFGDMREHQVELCCVDRMEQEGVTVVATISPLKPSVISTYESLNVGATFGGIYVNFNNKDKSSLSIHVITTDSLNQDYEAYVHYTQAEDGFFYVRGFKAEERRFDVYVVDRWGNTSDTVRNVLLPYQETKLNKRLFYPYILPGDIVCNAWGGNLAYAWNDDFTPPLFVHSPGGDIYPAWFTFDIGVEAKLSRYKFYHLFMEEHAFQRGNLKKWEVWGRTDVPPADGSWDGWTKLMDCNSHKPSGLPLGQHSAEDWEYLKAGEDFEFPADAPSVRYIRFKVLETWGEMDFIHFTEFTFWGNVLTNN